MSTSSSLDNLPLIGMIIKYFRKMMFKRVLRKSLKGIGETITPGITIGPFGSVILDLKNPESRDAIFRMFHESAKIKIDQHNHPEKYLDDFISEGNYAGAVSALKVLGRDFTKKELRQLFKIYLNWGHGKLLTVVMRKLGKKRLSYFQYHHFFRGLFNSFGSTHRPVEYFSANVMLTVLLILLKLPVEQLRKYYLTKGWKIRFEHQLEDRVSAVICANLLFRKIDSNELHRLMERMAIPERNLFHYVDFIEKIFGRVLDQNERELVFARWLFNFEGPFHEVHRFAFEDLNRQLNVDDINILLRKRNGSYQYFFISLIHGIKHADSLSVNQREQFIEAVEQHASENGIKVDDLRERYQNLPDNFS